MQYPIALDTDARQVFGHVPVPLCLLTDVDSTPHMRSLDVVSLELRSLKHSKVYVHIDIRMYILLSTPLLGNHVHNIVYPIHLHVCTHVRTYVTCPNNMLHSGTQLVYSGRAVGSHYGYSSSYHHKASGSDNLSVITPLVRQIISV